MFEKKKNDNFSKSFRCGRIAKRSDLMTGTDGRQYIKFTIAVNHSKEKADFFDCIAYNSEARYADRHFHKGVKVITISSDKAETYKDKNGITHKTILCVCSLCCLADNNAGRNIKKAIDDCLLFSGDKVG